MAGSASKSSVFICASAIDFYGNRRDENSLEGPGLFPSVCKKWEAVTKLAEDAGIRTVNIRAGVVLSAAGGERKKILPPFRMGGGGILGNGRQYMSWISLEDEVESIRFLIDNPSISGPVNLISPHPVTNHDFTKTLGKVLHRPTILSFPVFAARLLFGEMAEALLLGSTRVIPKKLVDAGYQFCHADLQSVLEDMLR